MNVAIAPVEYLNGCRVDRSVAVPAAKAPIVE